MDISLQNEIDTINSLLNVSSEYKEELEKQIQRYTTNQISKLNNNKEQELYKKINNILKQICNQIADTYKINVDSIYNNHKIKLNNDFQENCETESQQVESVLDTDDDESSDESTNPNSPKSLNTETQAPVCLDVKTLTKPIKCPANKGNNGQLCGRMTIKLTNFTYCGYHKKYFKP